MRTLKKVLALSMVFAMAFSMMAGAAFNDQDQIDASLVEDIQLLTALDVFQGDEKGDFNPTANVTRAQAAKMIYVLKNNGQDDEAAAFKGNSVYADVPSGHWAEGYINYATNLGIMSGWNEGSARKFDPNGNVTGIELTKMLLCMIGYRADVQGYTGNGWQTNVLRDGATSAITTNYLPTIYNAAPRQWTARLMANAVNAPYVTYSRGEVVMGHATDPSKSYGQQYLGLNTVEGYLRDSGRVSLAGGVISLDDDGDEIELSGTKSLAERGVVKSSLSGTPTTVFKTTVDPSLLGQYVKVYYKSSTLTTMDVKVYAVLATGQSKVYDKTLADVTVSKDKTKDYETIKFDGYNGGSAKQYGNVTVGTGESATTGGRSIKLVKNLDEVKTLTANTKTNGTEAENKAKGFADLSATSNANIRFVDQDNDGFIDLAFLEEVKYAIVDSHNAEKNTLRLKNANGKVEKLVDGDVVNSESAYKKINFVNEVVADDVVSVTLDCTSGTKVWNVAKVEPTTGSVGGYNLDGANYDSITLNGESTKIANGEGYRVGGYSKDAGVNTSLLNDTTFYTDGKYIIYSKGGDSVASVGSLAYLIGTQDYSAFQSTTWYAKVLLSDGTAGQYEIAATYKLKDGKLVETDTVNEGKFLKADRVYSYSISDNKITLSELKSDSSANGIKFGTGIQGYNNSSKRYTIGSANQVLSEDAYFFVKSNANVAGKEKYSVVKASELGKTMTAYNNAVTDYATKKINNIDTVVFGTLVVEGNAVATAAKYAFVKSAPSYTTVDGDHVAQMTVVLPNGEEQVIKDTFTNASGAYDKINDWTKYRGKVITYDVDAAGDVEKVEQISIDNYTVADGKLANDKWYAVRILGWNGSVASVDNVVANSNLIINIASDVKTHIVDGPSGSRTYFNYSDGSVVETAQIEDPEDEDNTVMGSFKSAIIYVSEVNGQQVITDIFCEEDGNDINALTSVPSAN